MQIWLLVHPLILSAIAHRHWCRTTLEPHFPLPTPGSRSEGGAFGALLDAANADLSCYGYVAEPLFDSVLVLARSFR